MSSPQATWKQIHLSHMILFDLCLRLEQTKANTKLMHLFIFLCKWYRSRHFVDYLSHTHHLNKKKKDKRKYQYVEGASVTTKIKLISEKNNVCQGNVMPLKGEDCLKINTCSLIIVYP